MAKHNSKAVIKSGKSCDAFETAKESAMLRTLRIDGSQNGATLRTRVVRDKTKYNRNLKHKKSLAMRGISLFMGSSYEYAKLECVFLDISLNYSIYLKLNVYSE